MQTMTWPAVPDLSADEPLQAVANLLGDLYRATLQWAAERLQADDPDDLERFERFLGLFPPEWRDAARRLLG